MKHGGGSEADNDDERDQDKVASFITMQDGCWILMH